MFQDLHSQRDDGVPTMIIISIISQLSKEVLKNKKDVFSSKSLRIASVTKMAANQGVNFFESYVCSGHSLSTKKSTWTKIYLH